MPSSKRLRAVVRSTIQAMPTPRPSSCSHMGSAAIGPNRQTKQPVKPAMLRIRYCFIWVESIQRMDSWSGCAPMVLDMTSMAFIGSFRESSRCVKHTNDSRWRQNPHAFVRAGCRSRRGGVSHRAARVYNKRTCSRSRREDDRWETLARRSPARFLSVRGVLCSSLRVSIHSATRSSRR